MKSCVLSATALLLSATAVGAVEGLPGPARPARAAPAAALTAEVDAAMAAARRREAERQKRWDDRMRRATRSLCDGC